MLLLLSRFGAFGEHDDIIKAENVKRSHSQLFKFMCRFLKVFTFSLKFHFIASRTRASHLINKFFTQNETVNSIQSKRLHFRITDSNSKYQQTAWVEEWGKESQVDEKIRREMYYYATWENAVQTDFGSREWSDERMKSRRIKEDEYI